MDTQQVNLAAGLLRRRDALQKRIEGLDPRAVTGLLQISTSRPLMPGDKKWGQEQFRGHQHEAGTEVVVSGEALKIVTDLMGSLLTRQMEDLNRQLAELGVTETMQATDTADDAPEAELQAGQPTITILGFGVVPGDLCGCDYCTAARADG